MGNAIYKISPSESSFTRVRNIRHYDYDYASMDVIAYNLPAYETVNTMSPIVYNNEIYAAVNSKLVKYDGIDSLAMVANSVGGPSIKIKALCVFNDKIYGGTYGLTSQGHLYEWNGTDAWVLVASQYSSYYQINHMVVYNNELYACFEKRYGYSYSAVLKWNGTDAWVSTGIIYDTLKSLVVYDDKLYVTSSICNLYEWDGGTTWTKLNTFTYNRSQTYPTTFVYNNKIHIGSTYSNRATILRWDGSGDLTPITDPLPGTASEQIWAIEYFKGSYYIVVMESTNTVSRVCKWDPSRTELEQEALHSGGYWYVGSANDNNYIYFGTVYNIGTSPYLIKYNRQKGPWIRAKHTQYKYSDALVIGNFEDNLDNDGTMDTVSLTLIAASGASIAYNTGKYGQGLSLTDYYLVTTGSVLRSYLNTKTEFTIACWFKLNANGLLQYPMLRRIFSANTAEGYFGVEINYTGYPNYVGESTTNQIRFEMVHIGGVSYVTADTYNDGSWHFVAMKRRGTLFSFVLDDDIYYETDTTYTQLAANIVISSTSYALNGIVDKFMIWDYALTNSECNAIYNNEVVWRRVNA